MTTSDDPQKNLELFKKENDYPGRFIGVGQNADSKSFIIMYAITARSASSRNRILVFENDMVRTAQADPSKDVGVANITLYPAIMKGPYKSFVVSNGVHTKPIVDDLKSGLGFSEANEKWDFEPDSSSTERISAYLHGAGLTFGRISRHGKSTQRDFYFTESKGLRPGVLYAICTYASNGEPPLSSHSAPYELPIEGTESQIADSYSKILPFFLSIAVMKIRKDTMKIENVVIINSQDSAKD